MLSLMRKVVWTSSMFCRDSSDLESRRHVLVRVEGEPYNEALRNILPVLSVCQFAI